MTLENLSFSGHYCKVLDEVLLYRIWDYGQLFKDKKTFAKNSKSYIITSSC